MLKWIKKLFHTHTLKAAEHKWEYDKKGERITYVRFVCTKCDYYRFFKLSH